MESPGNLPTTLGNAWVGTTAVAPFEYPLTAEPMHATASVFGEPVLPGYAACGCYVGAWNATIPPPRCPTHGGTTATPFMPFQMQWPANPFAPLAPPLSDSDIECIAKRAAELVLEALRTEATKP